MDSRSQSRQRWFSCMYRPYRVETQSKSKLNQPSPTQSCSCIVNSRQFTPTASFPSAAPYCCSGPSTALVACSSTWRAADARSRPGPGPGTPPPLSLRLSLSRLQPNVRSQKHSVRRISTPAQPLCFSASHLVPLHPMHTPPCPADNAAPAHPHQHQAAPARRPRPSSDQRGPLAGHWPV